VGETMPGRYQPDFLERQRLGRDGGSIHEQGTILHW
jgi:hypothetical protein